MGITNSSMINKGIDGGTGVYQPRTIADWLQRTPGGSGVDLNYGYFGPGSSILSKDITSSNASSFVGSDFFVNTFGAKVWDSLNSQTRVYNLIRKVAWGNTTGYRIRSGRNSSTTAVSEVGALPSIGKPGLQTVYAQPSFIVTSLGVSALAQFLGTLEGGIGDALAVAQETAMIDHIKRINQMLTASSYHRATSASTLIDSSWVTGGDVLSPVAGGGTDIQVSAVNSDATVDFVAPGTSTPASAVDNTTYRIKSRAGIYSIDDAIDVSKRALPDTTAASNYASAYASIDGVTAGNTPLLRTAGTWSAGNVFESGSGALRHLNTGMIDQAIDSVRRNGGEPDLIATGIEQVTRLGTILQANQHFIGEGTFQVKQGGEGTLLGYPTGFQVATYKGIPLFHDFDIATSWQAVANGDAKRGANVYVMDTRFLELPVLFTTQYLESRDYLQNNMLGIKGIFLTALQLRCYDFRKQAKIVDLSDGVNLS